MAESINTDETRELIASSKVEGTAVYNHNGDRLGTITSFMVDKRSGQAEYAVLQFGGFLGLGADYYPVPWAMLSYSTDHGGYLVDLDKDALDDAPRYGNDDEAPQYNADYDRTVNTHYGVID